MTTRLFAAYSALAVIPCCIGLMGCRDVDSPTAGAGLFSEERLEAAQTSPLPARVQDATNTLDLTQLPLMENAEEPTERTVVSLAYRAPGTPDQAGQYYRAHLAAKGWIELRDGSATPQYVSAILTKNGMRLSLTALPDQPGKMKIALRHHGNVALQSLPVPGGAKLLYGGPTSAIFTVESTIESAAREVANALVEKGLPSGRRVQHSSSRITP